MRPAFVPHSVPIAFQVDDVAVAREALEAKGVTFVTDMIDSGTCHQAIFLDPAGNSLDLHHIYAATQLMALDGRSPAGGGPRRSEDQAYVAGGRSN